MRGDCPELRRPAGHAVYDAAAIAIGGPSAVVQPPSGSCSWPTPISSDLLHSRRSRPERPRSRAERISTRPSSSLVGTAASSVGAASAAISLQDPDRPSPELTFTVGLDETSQTALGVAVGDPAHPLTAAALERRETAGPGIAALPSRRRPRRHRAGAGCHRVHVGGRPDTRRGRRHVPASSRRSRRSRRGPVPSGLDRRGTLRMVRAPRTHRSADRTCEHADVLPGARARARPCGTAGNARSRSRSSTSTT